VCDFGESEFIKYINFWNCGSRVKSTQT